MVNNGNTFSHITVSTDDEDDIVIQAGIREDSTMAGDSSEPGAHVSDRGKPETTVDSEEAVRDGSTEAATRASRARDEPYHETRLEDLKGTPMPMIQKAIIAVAVVFVVGVVVYYSFLS